MGAVRLLRCPECGFVGASLTGWRYPYEAKDYYAGCATEDFRKTAPQFVLHRVAQLGRLVPVGGRVAELGAGMGETAAALSGAGYRVAAVEESERAAQLASVCCPGVKWHREEISAHLSRVEAGRYDAITMYHVLEHVPDFRAMVALVRRALGSSGILVVEVPDVEGRARVLGGRWHHFLPHHVNYFTLASLRRLLESEGFELAQAERKYHFGFPQGRPLQDAVHRALSCLGLHDNIATLWRRRPAAD